MPGGSVTDTLLPKLGPWTTRLALYNSASSDAGRTGCIVTFMGPDAVPTTSNGEVTLEQRAAEWQGSLDKQTYLSRAGPLSSAARYRLGIFQVHFCIITDVIAKDLRPWQNLHGD